MLDEPHNSAAIIQYENKINYWKKVVLISVLTNIFFFGLLLYVKYDSKEQAFQFIHETELKSERIVNEFNKIHQYNNILWELAVEIAKGPQDKKSVILKCREWENKYKDQIELDISLSSKIPGINAWRVGWDRYALYLEFDENSQLKNIILDDLLDRLKKAPAQAKNEKAQNTPQ